MNLPYVSIGDGVLPHLVQGGLGHRVVIDGQLALILVELAEYVSQSSPCVRELVLQRVVMLLLQDAARELLLNEVFHRLQHDRTATDPHDDRVAVAKPTEESVPQINELNLLQLHDEKTVFILP